MKLEVKFRREDILAPQSSSKVDMTLIWIDTICDGHQDDTFPRLFISGPTNKIGHLDPDVNSMNDYREALGISE